MPTEDCRHSVSDRNDFCFVYMGDVTGRIQQGEAASQNPQALKFGSVLYDSDPHRTERPARF